ncbi:hypothetical protein HGRIS_010331 [Hohenbuehelia grisea]|uniref:DUF6534 domain-containing protein n=1 Tax=Hohenbuehelia grisea TaxID=104357 RepID=A0ABR3J5G2_9AGAR
MDFDIVNTLGAMEIGTMVSTFLFGITVFQAYFYFDQFPNDSKPVKLMVGSVCALELGHLIAILHAFFTISVLQYGAPEKIFAKTPIGIALASLASGYIACTVQVYFANRLKIFTGRMLLTTACWFLSFLRALATTGTTVVMLSRSLADMLKWNWLVGTSLAIGAIVDIAVSAGLCYDLVKERKGDSLSGTRKLIDSILLLTIQTGLLTSALTLAVTICALLMPNNFIWVAIYVCLTRVFSNSLLATLNTRSKLRYMTSAISSLQFGNIDIPLASFYPQMNMGRTADEAQARPRIALDFTGARQLNETTSPRGVARIDSDVDVGGGGTSQEYTPTLDGRSSTEPQKDSGCLQHEGHLTVHS